MKSVLLMRNAKADHQLKKMKATDRPLSVQGEESATKMGAWIKERELTPQIILASSAVRACRTAELFAQASGYQGIVREMDALYMAEWDDILSLLKRLPDEVERVMVIGHNPGLESILPLLTHQVVALPTAGVAYLSLPIEHWKDLKRKTHAELVELWRPDDVDAQNEQIQS